MNALSVLIAVLGVYRITRLITTDVIFNAPREWLEAKLKPGGYLDELLHCAWCVSFWVGCVVAGLLAVAPGLTPWLLLPLAASAVAGLLSQIA
jgi:hypothetical protein